LKKNLIFLPALVLTGVLAYAQAPAAQPAPQASGPAPTKIGIIKVADALQGTQEGAKAGEALSAKFGPKDEALKKKQADIQSLEEQRRKGGATLSPEKLAQIGRDIDEKTKQYNREREDAMAELDAENGKIMQELGTKMMEILGKYAMDNGYAVILDVSSQQTPVIWASTSTDVTQEIVKLYDQKYPVKAAAPAAAAPATSAPATSAPATAPPPAKKK
jgi:outer membrane protein